MGKRNKWILYIMGTGKFCPKCHLEKVKVELQKYPNHLLTCPRCSSIFKTVGEQLVQVLL